MRCKFWLFPNETVIWCSLWFDWNELHCWSNNVYASIECWLCALATSAKRLFCFLLSTKYNAHRQISRKTNSATQNVISMAKPLVQLCLFCHMLYLLLALSQYLRYFRKGFVSFWSIAPRIKSMDLIFCHFFFSNKGIIFRFSDLFAEKLLFYHWFIVFTQRVYAIFSL